MFREDLSAVLTDFGIARPQKNDVSMTQQGKVVGTPIYMSPEQSQDQQVDGRTDLYALGVIFYEMLTRELPYQAGDPFALAVQHIQDPIPTLPPELKNYQAFIDKLMAKNPDDRYQSGLELVKALDAFERQTETAAASPNNRPTASALSLSLAEEIQTETQSTKSLEVTEKVTRKLGILKRYGLECTIRSEEHQHFSILFSQLTTEIMDWYHLRKKQCGSIQLDCHVKPEMTPQVNAMVEQLLSDDGPYDFLSEKNFRLKITKG